VNNLLCPLIIIITPGLVDLKIIDQFIYIYAHTICQREGNVVVNVVSKRKWIMPFSWLGVS